MFRVELLVAIEVYEGSILRSVISACGSGNDVVLVELFAILQAFSTGRAGPFLAHSHLPMSRGQFNEFSLLPFLPVVLQVRVIWRCLPLDRDVPVIS